MSEDLHNVPNQCIGIGLASDFGCLKIASLDRGDDGMMLVEFRQGYPVAKMIDVEPENALALVEQVAHPRRNERIAAHFGDAGVKFPIEPNYAENIDLEVGFLELPLDFAQMGNRRRRRSCRGKPRTQSVQELHSIEIGGKRRKVELRHGRGPVLRRVNQTLGRQADQSLADRRTRYVEGAAEFGLVEKPARLQFEIEDFRLQAVVNKARTGPARPMSAALCGFRPPHARSRRLSRRLCHACSPATDAYRRFVWLLDVRQAANGAESQNSRSARTRPVEIVSSAREFYTIDVMMDSTMQCDVLVIGSGAAGLTAALKAAEEGFDVIVVEKETAIGGTTALSEGMIWVPLSAAARASNRADSREAAIAYLAAAAGPHFEPVRAAAYVDGAAEMLAFVEAKASLAFRLSTTSIDYHQSLPGATCGARAFNPGLFDARQLGADFARLRPPLASTMILGGMTIASQDLPYFFAMRRSPRAALRVAGVTARYIRDRLAGHGRGTRIANGNGLIGALLLALKKRRVPVHAGYRAERLVVQAGRVAGAAIRNENAGLTIAAGRAVILCCGGFSGSAGLRAKYYAHVAAGQSHHSLAPASNIGEGLALGCAAGGVLNENLAEPAAWTPVSLVPQAFGAPVPFPHYSDRGKPGIVAVTRAGRRFANEAAVYHRFVPAMIAACAGETDVLVWLIADHRAIRRYGLGAVPPSPAFCAPFVRSGYLACGRTLVELANQTGIAPPALEETIARFNRGAANGEDPEFGKGSSPYDRANGDPAQLPNPCLAPLATAPYYAVRLYAGDIATFIGLRTDAHARVLDKSGIAIEGLYAAGNDAASAMGGDYPAAGITIGSAMTFGYLAARHIGEVR